MAIIPWEYISPYTGTPFSALQIFQPLAQNALTLDGMSRKGRRAWTDQVDELAGNGGNPSNLCNAAFRFKTGMTTLTVHAFGNGPSGTHTLRIRLNGVQRGTLVLNNTEQSTTVTISGLGFAHEEIVQVDMDVQRSAGDPGVYSIRDAYVGPLTGVVGSWPGVPTFGSLSQGNLQQLVNAQQWCLDRMNGIDMPVPQGFLYRTLHNWPSTRLAWRGGVARSNGANRLFAEVFWRNINTASERLRFVINDVEVATTPTITTGETGEYDFSIDLSGYTDEALLRCRIEQVVNTAGTDRHLVGTRWNLRWVETSQSSWSYIGLPTSALPLESMTFATLQSRLNTIASRVSTVQGRITGSTDMWNRQRLFRQSPTWDAYQKQWHGRTYVARSRRFTDTLVVRGKGVKLIWGGLTIPAAEGDDDPYRKWTGAHEEAIIDGETVQTRLISFDTYPDLIPGTVYELIGEDLIYAAEVWR